MVWLQKDSERVRVGDMNANQGHRTRIAIDAVVSDVNLVALILAGNIGPSGFAAASMVCKSWLSVCREDERVLRGVAAYQGGLTKCVFMKLFAVSSQEADALQRAKRLRFGGGHYFLYRADAVDAVLAAGASRLGVIGCALAAKALALLGGPHSKVASVSPRNKKNVCVRGSCSGEHGAWLELGSRLSTQAGFAGAMRFPSAK